MLERADLRGADTVADQHVFGPQRAFARQVQVVVRFTAGGSLWTGVAVDLDRRQRGQQHGIVYQVRFARGLQVVAVRAEQIFVTDWRVCRSLAVR